MCPITHVSHLTVLTAVVASFVFGYLWYGPLFGQTWAQLAGMKIEDCKGKKPPVGARVLTLLGTSSTTLVFGYLLHAAQPCCNVGLALAVWLGFYVPLLLGSVTWEGKPWKLFTLNAAFYLLNLQLISAILTYVKF